MKSWWIWLSCVWLCVACGAQTAAPLQTQLTLAESLNRTDMTGFLRADKPRQFSFPADHGPHEGYAVEWWYYTGNLRDDAGREFGYQFTIFRSALRAPTPTASAATQSAWRGATAYMAHLAVTAVADQQFFAYERFNRDALGLAGAQAAPFKVWLDDWQVVSTTPDASQLQLRASQGVVALDLQLDNSMTPVLQGNAGLSQKSAGVGNASYYYSVPRMPTTGTLTIAGQAYQVTGTSWMDREWSTSALAADQVGWDWFAVHLDDGSDVMLYHLRRRDGSIDPYSGGSWRDADGKITPLTSADIVLQPVGQWTSPHTGANYPASWQITIARMGLDVTVTPLVADQELLVTVRYWEGAVAVKGQRDTQPIQGQGYLEMTGYADGGTRP